VWLKASWADLICHTHQHDCQTPSDQIPGDKPEQGTDDYEGKDFETRKVFRQEWKAPSTSTYESFTTFIYTPNVTALACWPNNYVSNKI